MLLSEHFLIFFIIFCTIHKDTISIISYYHEMILVIWSPCLCSKALLWTPTEYLGSHTMLDKSCIIACFTDKDEIQVGVIKKQ